MTPPHQPADPPTFSILCSAYQTERYLDATIGSVLDQTSGDWELVVVDNGMDDRIADIVRAHQHDLRVRLIRQENRRLAGGANAAAAAARGRYLVLLNSDDELLPHYCARMAEIVASRPEIDVVAPDSLLYQEAGGFDSARTHQRSLEIDWHPDVDTPWGLRDMFRGAYPHYGATVRREAWDAVGGFRMDVHKVEDIDLWLRLAHAGFTVRVVPDVLTRFRIRHDSDSKAVGADEVFEDAREAVLTAAARDWGTDDDQRILEATLRRHRYHRALRRARAAFVAGDVAAARREAAAAHAARRSARTAVVVAGLAVAPRLLGRVHRLRSRTTPVLDRALGRLRHRGVDPVRTP